MSVYLVYISAGIVSLYIILGIAGIIMKWQEKNKEPR